MSFFVCPPPLKLLYCFSSFFQLLVLSHSTISQADDLYIEEPGSGDVPIDDEDGEDDGSGSGSGSGDHDSTSNFVDEDLSTSASPVDATTDISPPVNEEILVDTKVLIKVESDNFPEGRRNNRRNELNSPQEVTSENLWERTEVLAAVIACGVVGFLCAISLLLLLAYRMKKKDEGSYDLGDTKMSATAYHKAPTKEFYA
uniref:Syndecan n=1 Tax=Xiphophorus couchianus TaxID=32473 RepID=A0A3B5MD75_9TELE